MIARIAHKAICYTLKMKWNARITQTAFLVPALTSGVVFFSIIWLQDILFDENVARQQIRNIALVSSLATFFFLLLVMSIYGYYASKQITGRAKSFGAYGGKLGLDAKLYLENSVFSGYEHTLLLGYNLMNNSVFFDMSVWVADEPLPPRGFKGREAECVVTVCRLKSEKQLQPGYIPGKLNFPATLFRHYQKLEYAASVHQLHTDEIVQNYGHQAAELIEAASEYDIEITEKHIYLYTLPGVDADAQSHKMLTTAKAIVSAIK